MKSHYEFDISKICSIDQVSAQIDQQSQFIINQELKLTSLSSKIAKLGVSASISYNKQTDNRKIKLKRLMIKKVVCVSHQQKRPKHIRERFVSKMAQPNKTRTQQPKVFLTSNRKRLS